ncbi:MAG: NAD(P)H-hydrate epimerase [Planctomycetota bacterium]|nr:NAD(P)H-hydrate epimerase [Planctomycetota bacterium]
MIRLTREQVRSIDRIAVERYGIPGIVLMENAARGAADVAEAMLAGKARGEVLIFCGGGNNGGDGLAAARHLHNRGFKVCIVLTTDSAKYGGDAVINWQIVQSMDLAVMPFDAAAIVNRKPSLILDAIFGTGLTQAPRDPFGEIAGVVQGLGVPILAIDIPSGLDCDTGKPLGRVCIRANRTVTFVAEKVGFAQPAAREFLGEVIVADIGCPRELIDEVSGH